MAVFIAAGDQGAYPRTYFGYNCSGSGPQVTDPSSQPYVTSAGVTTLTTSANQGYASETVWNGLATNGSATGGGVSSYWPIPWYQEGLATSDTEFSGTMRNTPDLSLNADPYTGYYIYCNAVICTESAGFSGGWIPNVGGTSAVAPQLAAFWGLVSKGLGSRAGFANPTIYGIAADASRYSAYFHDVTVGNNGCTHNDNEACDYDAFAGYDNATGWGSYNGALLYAGVMKYKHALAALLAIINLLLD